MGLVCLLVAGWGCDLSVEPFSGPSRVRIATVEFDPDAAATAVSGPDACIAEDPCAGASGRGYLQGFKCDLDARWVSDPEITCEEALALCQTHAAEFPEHSYLCEWNGQQIFTEEVEPGACDDEGPALGPCDGPDEPDPCDPCADAEGVGLAYIDMCGIDGGSVFTAGSTCQAAFDNCLVNVNYNPTSSFYCEWNGTEIFRNEVVADACVPEYGPKQVCGDPVDCLSADPCAGAIGLGFGFISLDCEFPGEQLPPLDQDDGISCEDAHTACLDAAAANPGHSINCRWNDRTLLFEEVVPGECADFGPVPPSCEA